MSTIKFGGKPTVDARFDKADKRLGKTTGASKGSKPAPKVKVTPKASMKDGGTIGVTFKKKF